MNLLKCPRTTQPASKPRPRPSARRRFAPAVDGLERRASLSAFATPGTIETYTFTEAEAGLFLGNHNETLVRDRRRRPGRRGARRA